MLRMQGGRLFPEGALGFERHDAAVPVGEGVRNTLGDPRSNRMDSVRLLVGERSKLELHGAPDVPEADGKDRRVVKQQVRFRAVAHCGLKDIGLCRGAQCPRDLPIKERRAAASSM